MSWRPLFILFAAIFRLHTHHRDISQDFQTPHFAAIKLQFYNVARGSTAEVRSLLYGRKIG
jgi:hypothetical protein